MSRTSGGTLPGAEHTLFAGYGPFVALIALVLAMALLAPTIAPERVVTTLPGPATGGDRRSSVTGGVTQERRDAAAGVGGGDRRSSVTGGVTQERRSEDGAEDGAGDGGVGADGGGR